MPDAEWLFDGTLGILLLVLAGAALHARSLYAAVVMFIALGLMLALTWARLGAPDLALAEAAIGAGVTGALLFSTLYKAGMDRHKRATPNRIALLLPGLAFLLLLTAAWPLPEMHSPLPDQVMAHLKDSGVSHPVTAVLLNFRAWDTLLEVSVVLIALLGVRQLYPSHGEVPTPWPLMLAWGRLLAPLTVIVGGYLLWRGTDAPGGAFQAGTVLAAGGVALRLIGVLPPLGWHQWPVRLLVLAGVLVFVAVAALTAWLGQGWLHYPTGSSKVLILLIELMATASIATTLTLLVVGEKRELRP
jgi:multisubunit Na+/H+ antiporter MnhB subunit